MIDGAARLKSRPSVAVPESGLSGSGVRFLLDRFDLRLNGLKNRPSRCVIGCLAIVPVGIGKQRNAVNLFDGLNIDLCLVRSNRRKFNCEFGPVGLEDTSAPVHF